MASMATTAQSGCKDELAGEEVGQVSQNANGLHKIDYRFESKLEDETFTFGWTLENYTTIAHHLNEVTSPVAIGGTKCKHSWQLKLRPKNLLEGVEYLSVSLSLLNFGEGVPSTTHSIKARFQLSLLNADGYPVKQLGYREMDALEFRRFSDLGWRKASISADINRYLVNDALRLHCVVWIESEVEHFGLERLSEHSIPTIGELRFQGQLAFANDIARFFKDSLKTDIAIKMYDDPEASPFMAHKAILRARSPYFERLLSSSKCEIIEVVVKYFDSETVHSMLEWMYTGKTAKMVELAPDLLQIATKYELKELKDKCEMILSSKLYVDNVSRICVLAHIYNAPYLKKRAMEFMIRNKERVVKTNGFKEVAVTYRDCGVFLDFFKSSMAEELDDRADFSVVVVEK